MTRVGLGVAFSHTRGGGLESSVQPSTHVRKGAQKKVMHHATGLALLQSETRTVFLVVLVSQILKQVCSVVDLATKSNHGISKFLCVSALVKNCAGHLIPGLHESTDITIFTFSELTMASL